MVEFFLRFNSFIGHFYTIIWDVYLYFCMHIDEFMSSKNESLTLRIIESHQIEINILKTIL